MRCLCVLILLTAANLQAQVQEAATPFSGMAGVDCASFSPWCIFSNPAGTSRTDRITAGISYRRILDLKELSTKAVFALFPCNWGIPGITYTHFGYEKYNEQLLSLSYGRRLGRFTDFGAKIDYLFSFVEKQSGVRQAFFFETGLLFSFPGSFQWGIRASNPGDIARLTAPEQLYVTERYSSAVSWQPDERFRLAVQADLTDKIWYFSAGAEFTCADFLIFRGGFKTKYNGLYAGVGLGLNFLEIAVNYNTSDRLGNTLHVSLCGRF